MDFITQFFELKFSVRCLRKYEIPLLIIFLEIILLLRLINFSYNNFITENPDANRNYLVAHNIVAHKEFILVGPKASMFYPYLNLDLDGSPLYYYVLAAFLFINDTLLTLWFTNVILSLLVLVFLYFLAKKMFGIGTSLIATILFGFSDLFLNISTFYVWQPWVMLPFINLSFLFLLTSCQKKNYSLLFLSIFLLAFSGSIHYSALSFTPLYMVLTFFILKKQDGHFIQKYILGIFVLVSTLIIFHLPSALYLITTTYKNGEIFRALMSISFRENPLPISTPIEFLDIALTYIRLLTNSFFLNYNKNFLSLNNITLLIIGGSFMYYLYLIKKQVIKKRFFIIILTFILQPIILLAIFGIKPLKDDHAQPVGYGYLHYLAPIFTLFFIIISETVWTSLSQNSLLKIARAILIFTLIVVTSPSLKPNIEAAIHRVVNKQFFYNSSTTTQEAANAILVQIISLRQYDNTDTDYSFFQLKTEGNHYGGFYNGAAFWNILEQNLHVKFTKNDNKSPDRFTPVNADNSKYIFLLCYKYNNQVDEEDNCVRPFLRKNSDYEVYKKIYSSYPLSVHGMMKQDM